MKESSAAKITLICLSLIAIVAGMVISAFFLSRFMLKVQRTTEKSITVKGVAEKEIVSDVAAFYCNISVVNVNRASGYTDLTKKAEVLKSKLKSLGFKESMFEDQSISCEDVNRTITVKENNKDVTKSVFDHYELTYSLRVRTTDVRLVEKNVLRIYELAAERYNIGVGTPQYFISNPEQYKLELVDKASASAAERARTAASQSGSKLGALIKAKQGVIQITAPASNDTSDYGVYNTGSVVKVMRMVMTLEFSLK
ncbi:MAG: SIMPL domain-containing protein [Lentisphaeria bacterium]|nr:SIMPL domain-containing protein [Lentisphaeria bacterium]